MSISWLLFCFFSEVCTLLLIMTMIKQNPGDVEIRKLPADAILKLCRILDSNEGWKKLMAVVPVECIDGNSLKYKVEDMK